MDHDYAKVYRVMRVLLQIIQILLDLYRTWTMYADRRDERRRNNEDRDRDDAGGASLTPSETQVNPTLLQCTMWKNLF